jgi:hypothetical protein
MRNKYPGNCYVCGLLVESGTGYFEKIIGTRSWRVKHAPRAVVGGVTCSQAAEKQINDNQTSTGVQDKKF